MKLHTKYQSPGTSSFREEDYFKFYPIWFYVKQVTPGEALFFKLWAIIWTILVGPNTKGLGVSLTLCCFVVYSTRRFVLCLTLCHFVLVFFRPFSIAITSLGEERANLSAFRTFVRFVLVWICRFPLPLGVWEGLRVVIMALPGLFSYLFFFC